jgi:hypothetical protein
MPKFFRGDGWLKLKHGDHGEHGGHGEGLLCHVRGADAIRKKGSSVVSVSLRGLRVSRFSRSSKS